MPDPRVSSLIADGGEEICHLHHITDQLSRHVSPTPTSPARSGESLARMIWFMTHGQGDGRTSVDRE